MKPWTRKTLKISVAAIAVLFLVYVGAIIGYSLANPKGSDTARGVLFSGNEDSPVTTEAIDIHKLWSLSNDERAKAGQSPLVLSKVLGEAASDKCADMVNRDYWSHETPDGKKPYHFIQNKNLGYQFATENLAYGYLDAAGTVTGWMNSEGHRNNLLNARVTDTGFAVCLGENFQGKGRQLIVVQFSIQK